MASHRSISLDATFQPFRFEREEHPILTQTLVELSWCSLPIPLTPHAFLLLSDRCINPFSCVFPANPQHPTALQHRAASAAAGTAGLGPQRANSGAENYSAGSDPCGQRPQYQPDRQHPTGEHCKILCAKRNVECGAPHFALGVWMRMETWGFLVSLRSHEHSSGWASVLSSLQILLVLMLCRNRGRKRFKVPLSFEISKSV